MRRLASIISARHERIPQYLDARQRRSESLANPSSLGFLRRLDLPAASSPLRRLSLPRFEAGPAAAILESVPRAVASAAPSTGPLESAFDEIAAPSPAAIEPVPRAVASDAPLTGLLEAVTAAPSPATPEFFEEPSQSIAPGLEAGGDAMEAAMALPQEASPNAAAETGAPPELMTPLAIRKAFPRLRSRVEEVIAPRAPSPEAPEAEDARAGFAETKAASSGQADSRDEAQSADALPEARREPDRSPRVWAERMRKMIEAEAASSERAAALPLSNQLQTRPSAPPPAASPEWRESLSQRRFIAPMPIGRSASFAQATLQGIAPPPQVAREGGAAVETAVAPQAAGLTGEPARTRIEQTSEAPAQATLLPNPSVEGFAGIARRANPRFVPPAAGVSFVAGKTAIPRDAFPIQMAGESLQLESEAGEAVERPASQPGLPLAPGNAPVEGLRAGAEETLARAADELPEPWRALPDWVRAQGGSVPHLFARPSPPPGGEPPGSAEPIAEARPDEGRANAAKPATAARVPPDLDEIARQVYPILKRRLDAERRRELF